ncbi:hypothetical protein [Cupriavidus taiwanensis]|uniref:hypothetical protein n=1 Tax=Cupriavidus taiwanensis TaxID=164546 RepID=UPI0018DDFC95
MSGLKKLALNIDEMRRAFDILQHCAQATAFRNARRSLFRLSGSFGDPHFLRGASEDLDPA